MIELNDFSIGFERRELLVNANARINDGELTALLGRNGAGKSTMLRAIAGLNRSYAGTVRLNGSDIREMSPSQLSRNIAFVSTRRTRIPNMRCRDVVAMGRAPYTNWIGNLSADDNAIVEQSLTSVGMAGYADRTLDKMSDGECQRIMIARALAQSTPILVLDEPTSFLDLPNRYELCRLLAQLAHEQGKCALFSTHELDIALALCDSISLIDTPHLQCLPTPLMKESGIIDRLFSINGPIYQ